MNEPLLDSLQLLHEQRAALIRSHSIAWPSSGHPAPEVADEIERLTTLILAHIDVEPCCPLQGSPRGNVLALRATPVDVATLV